VQLHRRGEHKRGVRGKQRGEQLQLIGECPPDAGEQVGPGFVIEGGQAARRRLSDDEGNAPERRADKPFGSGVGEDQEAGLAPGAADFVEPRAGMARTRRRVNGDHAVPGDDKPQVVGRETVFHEEVGRDFLHSLAHSA